MAEAKISNFHVEYMPTATQHWSWSSQRFAGGDNLITAIYNGWSVDRVVEVEQHWYAGMRGITIFNFTISREDMTVTMPVVSNPFVNRFVRQSALQLVDKEAAEHND